jgi:hypothetical protein
MGALSVVISAILSHFLLKEKLSVGNIDSIISRISLPISSLAGLAVFNVSWAPSSSVILCRPPLLLLTLNKAMNAPDEQSVTTIEAFKHFFLAPWFLAYGGLVLAVALGIIVFVAPKRGSKNMIWYILVCSLFGGLSVSCTQALGACVVTSIRGDNQVSFVRSR